MSSGTYLTVEITGNLDKVLENVDKIREQCLVEIGMDMQRFASLAAPRDTGRLSDSITYATSKKKSSVRKKAKEGDGVQKAQDKYTVVAGTNVEYAIYVEKGARGRGARPYLYPALANHVDEFKKIIEEKFNKI